MVRAKAAKARAANELRPHAQKKTLARLPRSGGLRTNAGNTRKHWRAPTRRAHARRLVPYIRAHLFPTLSKGKTRNTRPASIH